MPLAHLIFFAEPRELTEAQYEEERSLGHLRESSAPDGDSVRYPVTQVPDQKPAAAQPAPGVPAVKPPGAPSAPGDKPKETA